MQDRRIDRGLPRERLAKRKEGGLEPQDLEFRIFHRSSAVEVILVNLAQLIDPEWVQERFPRRDEPREQAAQLHGMAPPLKPIVGATNEEGIHGRIREILQFARRRLTLREIRDQLPDVPAKLMSSSVAKLVQLKHVDWNGARRNYRYGLTERGRSRVRG